MEEELSNSGSNDVEVCISDVNLNQDFVDQAADDPDEVNQSEVENQGNGSSGFSDREEPASNADTNSRGQESGNHTAMDNGCLQCGKGFSTASKLAKHIKVVHVPKKKCNVCQKLICAAYFNTHVKEVHEGDRRECPECKKEIASSKFSQHMQIAHLGFKEACPRCGKQMSTSLLSTHIKEEHDGVRKKCPHCPKQFKNKHLKAHIREVHQAIREKCPHCSKLFRRSNLSKHIKTVHQDNSTSGKNVPTVEKTLLLEL